MRHLHIRWTQLAILAFMIPLSLVGLSIGDVRVVSAPASATLLAAGRPLDVAVKGGYVYWSELPTEFCSSPGALKRVPTAGGTAQTLYSNCSFSPGNIAVDSEWVYAVNWQGDKIAKIPVAGGGPTNIATANGAIFHRGLAVDDTFVFWADDDGVKRATKDGTSTVTLSGADVNDLAIDVAYVYWTEGGPGSGAVRRIDKSGGTAQTLASSGLDYPGSIAVAESYTYWAETTALKRAPKVGGVMPMTVYSEAGSQMTSVAVQGPFLYWSQTDWGGSIGSGKVRRNSKAGGIKADIETGLSGPDSLNLDSQYVYWGDRDGVKRANLPTAPSLWIEGGQSFFKPEWAEATIPGPVFLRGGSDPIFRANVSATAVSVDILAPGVGAGLPVVKNVLLTQTAAGQWKGAWDWTSSSWSTIPDQIPVGAYVARFKVTQGSSPKSYELPLFVIFNPSEVKAPARFEFNEVGIWFYSPEEKYWQWGADLAIPYQLHPDDNRIFGQAIQLVTGQTSPYQASQFINTWTLPAKGTFDCSGSPYPSSPYYNPNYAKPIGSLPPGKRFRWSICTSASDALGLLARTDEAAQCADSANLFVALLRSMGIPAHPTTGDARISQNTWVFDTWAEARLKSTVGEDWYALHPHEGYGPEPRSVFGPAHWVSKKANNDLIIMAKENWNASKVSDWCPGQPPNGVWKLTCTAHDVKFKYGTNNRPLQNLSHQASWIDNVSQTYWGVPHWTMMATAEDRVPEDEDAVSLRVSLDRDQYGPGDTVQVTIVLINESDVTVESTLMVTTTADFPLTKKAGDALVHLFQTEVAVPPHGSQEVSDSYDLPLELSADNLHEVEAAFAGRRAAATFALAQDFGLILSMPGQLIRGQTFTVEAEIINQRDTELSTILVTTQLPHGLITQDEEQQWIPSIPPGRSQTTQWRVTAQSYSEVSQVWIHVTTEDGGNVSTAQGIQVAHSLNYLPLILNSSTP